MKPHFSTIAYFLLAASPAWAVIDTITPLEKIVGDSHVVALAKVEKLSAEKMTTVLVVEETLRGEAAISRFNVRLEGQPVADARLSPQDLLQRIEPGSRIVLFVSHTGSSELIFAYTCNTWFHLTGVLDGDVVRAEFQNAEPFLRKTYSGSVDELANLVRDHAAGKAALPQPDRTGQPGLGPVVGASAPSLSQQPPPTSMADSRFEYPPAEQQPRTIPPLAIWTVLAVGAMGLVFMLLRSTPLESSHA
jgi:hypothetical protein